MKRLAIALLAIALTACSGGALSPNQCETINGAARPVGC